MKKHIKPFLALILICSGIIFLPSFLIDSTDTPHFNFPYKQAGLTDRQAAAHLLSRFTYGSRPGDIDAAVKLGAEKWFLQQLDSKLPDDSLNAVIGNWDVNKMSNEEILAAYPRPVLVRRMAIQDGVLSKDSANAAINIKDRAKLAAYMKQKGIKPQQDLFRQFINQKIVRAAYSKNQMQEVLTDFWFNHFNVSLTKNACAVYIPTYERDVIRPNVAGKFETLLLATAKSPAMLLYLDNFSSSGTNSNMAAMANNSQAQKRLQALQSQMKMGDSTSQQAQILKRLQQAKKAAGLNENYAREVMELHTLGVDGGYTQADVTQAARVLTGWTVNPKVSYGGNDLMKKAVAAVGKKRLEQAGLVEDGDFIFAANRHDNGEKTVLGKSFPANGGYQEGVELLKMLAHNASTAKFISKKIAVRFVSDNPPQTLIDKMAKSFVQNDGDIKQVLITMASSPEFWSKEALREKTKSPFELAISSVRALNATVQQPYQLNTWITKMGQKIYYYQAPTGFPDQGQYWINTGSLLNRMNFGLAISSQRIPGTRIDLKALNNNHEPESAKDALEIYSRLMMPERDLQSTIKRLAPMLNNPELEKKINDAAGTATVLPAGSMEDISTGNEKTPAKIGKVGGKNKATAVESAAGTNSMLAQVVGIIIGSPEYQRK